jgi:hypothetical protein
MARVRELKGSSLVDDLSLILPQSLQQQKASDMNLILPGPKCETIHAHKSILSTTSGLLDGVVSSHAYRGILLS